MALTKDRVEKFKSFESFLEEKLDAHELSALEADVDLELKALDEMRESISREITAYMAQEKIGFNELTRRIGSSSRQISRMLKGEANLTLASIAELAVLMKKTPKITFEP